MEITLKEHTIHIQVIELAGRLDAFSVSALRETQDQFLAENQNYFVVDLSKLHFMDSAGLSALVSLLKRARQAGGNVVLVKPNDPAAERILILTRFDQVFLIAKTIDEAYQQVYR